MNRRSFFDALDHAGYDLTKQNEDVLVRHFRGEQGMRHLDFARVVLAHVVDPAHLHKKWQRIMRECVRRSVPCEECFARLDRSGPTAEA